jgi:hypothetical protein
MKILLLIIILTSFQLVNAQSTLVCDFDLGNQKNENEDVFNNNVKFSNIIEPEILAEKLKLEGALAKIYSYEKNIYIRLREMNNLTADMQIFSASGEKLFYKLLNSQVNKFTVNFLPGYYTVQVHYQGQTISDKVLIR